MPVRYSLYTAVFIAILLFRIMEMNTAVEFGHRTHIGPSFNEYPCTFLRFASIPASKNRREHSIEGADW